ncbi:hypothetical protein VKT23_020552 [Stygiomarasmius scandens]|uniref:CxC2-like cysteine cluster KDZ transposase-associated domain-containing protein n=1 Tax=Marasmiellus scandens TaxID=2682957 RepID=A0ABR1IKL7_9AGAR
MSSSQPTKKRKTTHQNPLAGANLGQWGLSLFEPNDAIITRASSSITQDPGFSQEGPSSVDGNIQQVVMPMKKVKRRLYPSDRPVQSWIKLHDSILAAMMTLKGRGDYVPDTCLFCLQSHVQGSPKYRCLDCNGATQVCEECIVEHHWSNPFHRVEKWNDKFFEWVSLSDLGLRIQLEHLDGTSCSCPLPASQGLTVLHSNGIHEVKVDYCGCACGVHLENWEQIIRNEWFPATTEHPQTCCTFHILELFHILNLEGKVTTYNFYDGLEKLTDNTRCGKLKHRYYAFLWIVHLWRHFRMLKRGGMGVGGLHPGPFRNIDETHQGELAVQCIACPIPGVNLPEDWQSKPVQFLYNFFLAIDTCFRLKRRKFSSWEKDPSLQDGWAYFVKHKPYKAWCDEMKDQKEISTCTSLATLDYANTKFNTGYDASGGGVGICARHENVLANGYAQTQVGERYANIDYMVASLLQNICSLLFLIISYDIACQWSKKIVERFQSLPPLVRLILIMRIKWMRFVIPKLHILGHLLKCQELFSLNYTPGAGETDTEGIEPLQSLELVQDYGSWCALEVTINEVPAWKKMVDDYESDVSEANPYMLPKSGITLQEVRLELAKEEEDEAKRGIPAICDMVPAEFIFIGLEIEAQHDISACRNPTPKELSGFVGRRTKITRQIKHFRSLQLKYMPISLEILTTHPIMIKGNSLPNAEDIPLLLPSALSHNQRHSRHCKSSLPKLEDWLRDAQLEESLNKLRHGLLVKRRLLDYKKRNARHQGPTTRSHSVINLQQHRIDSAAATYRDAWTTKLGLVDGNCAEVGWEKLEKDDVCCMEDLDEALRKQRAAARRKGELPPEGAGESRMLISWIWETTKRGVNGSTETVLFNGLRVEWCKAYARVRRYREELLLLKEEMRRCLVTLEWQAKRWESRATASTLGGAYAEGVSAYCHQQAMLKWQIAEHFDNLWVPFNIPSISNQNSPSLDFSDIETATPLPEVEAEDESSDTANEENEEEEDMEEVDEDAEQDEEDIPMDIQSRIAAIEDDF